MHLLLSFVLLESLHLVDVASSFLMAVFVLVLRISSSQQFVLFLIWVLHVLSCAIIQADVDAILYLLGVLAGMKVDGLGL